MWSNIWDTLYRPQEPHRAYGQHASYGLHLGPNLPDWAHKLCFPHGIQGPYTPNLPDRNTFSAKVAKAGKPSDQTVNR